jgi:hypothetical protein
MPVDNPFNCKTELALTSGKANATALFPYPKIDDTHDIPHHLDNNLTLHAASNNQELEPIESSLFNRLSTVARSQISNSNGTICEPSIHQNSSSVNQIGSLHDNILEIKQHALNEKESIANQTNISKFFGGNGCDLKDGYSENLFNQYSASAKEIETSYMGLPHCFHDSYSKRPLVGTPKKYRARLLQHVIFFNARLKIASQSLNTKLLLKMKNLNCLIHRQ